MRKSLNNLSSGACNSTIASSKQRLEQINLTAIQRTKLKKAYELSKSHQLVNYNTNAYPHKNGLLPYNNNV